MIIFILQRHCIVGVDNCKVLGVLEGLSCKAKSVKQTAKHPAVSLQADIVLEVLINHFWGSVHESGVLLKLLDCL